MKKQSAKVSFLKIFPDALCARLGEGYRIYRSRAEYESYTAEPIGRGRTSALAWQDALECLKKEPSDTYRDLGGQP